MSNHSQVVVSGAGPVGLASAIRFAQKGLEVTLIDSGDYLNDSPRACAYLSSVLEGLDALSPGLLDDMRAISNPAESIGFYSPDIDWRIGIGAPPPQAGPYAQPLQVGQEEVGQLLLNHLKAFPNVQVKWNTRLVGLRDTDTGVTLQLETKTGHKTMTCDWLVGADGAASATRELLGLTFDGITWPIRMFATNVDFDFTKTGHFGANFRMHPDSYAVIVRVNKANVWRVAFGEDGSLPDEGAIERATNRLSEFIPEGEAFNVLRLNPYRVHQRASETMRKGRVILAGDAGHITNPVGGLGLSTGFWDAFILGDLLPAVINKEIGEEALDAYSEERLKVFSTVTSPAASFNLSSIMERDPAKRAKVREAFEGMLYTPAGMANFGKLPFSLIGNPILPNSPWQKYYNPTAH